MLYFLVPFLQSLWLTGLWSTGESWKSSSRESGMWCPGGWRLTLGEEFSDSSDSSDWCRHCWARASRVQLFCYSLKLRKERTEKRQTQLNILHIIAKLVNQRPAGHAFAALLLSRAFAKLVLLPFAEAWSCKKSYTESNWLSQFWSKRRFAHRRSWIFGGATLPHVAPSNSWRVANTGKTVWWM